ncbi:hypothetical protein OAK30_06615, partial [Candidatus Nitrosopelagicus sp.]|nr:hypothetical protein [Candidatus Nitrosopelagicus sp.]
MEHSLATTLEQTKLGRKEIIFADLNSNFNEIKKKVNENKNILIISFDYKSHKILNDKKLKHEISDKFISDIEYKS